MGTLTNNSEPTEKTRSRLAFTLLVLLGINTMNFYDRQVLGAVGEPLKNEWQLSDFALGNLGTAFILLYAVVGVPLGHWADVGRRKTILAVGVSVWSVLTSLSGFAWSFASLFVLRLGVGVGEASCAPAANSLLGDLFPAQRRARAISLFMLGLPVGLGLSFAVSGIIARHWGWRQALFVAGLPGLLLGLLTLGIPEPARGAAEHHEIGAGRRDGSRLVSVLRIPTMWWIILSGALHNFNMYALGHFLSPLLIRYHGLKVDHAGWVSAVVYGFGGGFGVLFGGWLCDRIIKRRISGRLEVAAVSLLISAPCLYLALQPAPGDWWGTAAWLLPGCMCLYFYYSGVYASIQDIVEPSLRGTAMALYFCAMYLLGAALGPSATGLISDYFARRATIAAEDGVALSTSFLSSTAAAGVPAGIPWVPLLVGQEKARLAVATGLHDAMYVVPLLGGLLVLVLLVASRTVKGDYDRLQSWMAQSKKQARPLDIEPQD